MSAQEIEIVRFETSWLRDGFRPAQVAELKCFGDRFDDRVRDFILHREHVLELALVGLRPESGIIFDTNESGRDAQPAACTPHACFENESNTEPSANLLDGDIGAFECKGRRA